MTLRTFIDRLGGPTRAGELFGVSCEAVCNWCARGELPARWHLRAVKIAQQRGIRFDPERAAA